MTCDIIIIILPHCLGHTVSKEKCFIQLFLKTKSVLINVIEMPDTVYPIPRVQWVHHGFPSSINRGQNHRIIKNFFLTVALLHLEAILPCPITNALVKSPSPSVSLLQALAGLKPPLLQAEPPQLSQSLWQSCSSPVPHFWIQQVHIPPTWGAPEQDAGLQVGSHESRITTLSDHVFLLEVKSQASILFLSLFLPHYMNCTFFPGYKHLTSRFCRIEGHLSSPAIFSRHQI